MNLLADCAAIPTTGGLEGHKETLHRYVQIVGKVRLEHSPFKNHWWHVTFYVDPHGLSARHMFSSDLPFEISFDFIAQS